MLFTLCAGLLAGCEEPAGDALLPPGEAPEGTYTNVQIGSPLPALAAEGWIGGEPAADELSGNVVVVSCWAYWCGPCRAEAPHLVETYVKFRNEGVKFVGLTPDGDDKLPLVQKAVDELHLQWPQAYGASATLDRLGVLAFPTIIVVGRDGRIAWDSFRGSSLEEQIRKALAR
jgi:thiol-disulfide isomerase/thioredoxin